MHGDLKPQNVLIHELGGFHIKLCDFDSARDVRARESFANNGTSLKFSREYVCPEVFRGRYVPTGSLLLLASLEIDLFSLGLMCAFLLNSRLGITTLLPFELPDEELEGRLFDQSYLNSILQCEGGYRTFLLAYLFTHYCSLILTHSLVYLERTIVIIFINFVVSSLVAEAVLQI